MYKYNNKNYNDYDPRIVKLIRMHRRATGFYDLKFTPSKAEILFDLDSILDMVGQSRDFKAQSCAKIFEILAIEHFTWDEINISIKSKLIAALELYVRSFNDLDVSVVLGVLDNMRVSWNHLTVDVVTKLNMMLALYLMERKFNEEQILKNLEAVINIGILEETTLQSFITSMQGKFKSTSTFNSWRIYSCFHRYCSSSTKTWQSFEKDCNVAGISIRSIIDDANRYLRVKQQLSTPHRNVKNILTSMNLNTSLVDHAIIGSYTADIYIPACKTVILFNELQDFDTAGMVSVKQTRRQEFLQRMGYDVISLNYQDWSALGTDEEKQSMLKAILPKNIFSSSNVLSIDDGKPLSLFFSDQPTLATPPGFSSSPRSAFIGYSPPKFFG